MNFARPSDPTQTHADCKTGFTLVELLLVIAIIGVLASLALAVVGGAQAEARRSATVAQISQIESMLLQRLEEYQVRRVPIRLTDFTTNPTLIRQIRDMMLADILRVEMPYQSANVGDFPSMKFEVGLQRLVDWRPSPPNVNDFTALDRNNLISLLRDNPQYQPSLMSRFVAGEQPAEYLYGVLALTSVNDSSGVDLLSTQAIGDVDGDGFLEVVDAWGDPLTFTIQQVDAETPPPSIRNSGIVWEDLYWPDSTQNGTPTTTETQWPVFVELNPEFPRTLQKVRIVVGSVNIE